MEIVKFENFSFKYPNENKPALIDLNISIKEGEFITLCGKTGCGKSTLLRSIKPMIAPSGTKSGKIMISGKNVGDISNDEQVRKIGLVLQNPDNQIVTDKVWHELAFGLESLGESSAEIRLKVAETASFFGIQKMFYEDVSKLSGGQKQLLSLASVMVMKPDILILDEPTSMLDPIAAEEFITALVKINKEIGTTIILSEHRLSEVFSVSDRILVLEDGRLIADGAPAEVGLKLRNMKNEMFCALPVPIRVFADIPNRFKCPLSISDGRRWLLDILKDRGAKEFFKTEVLETENVLSADDSAIELKDVWFKYENGGEYVLKGMNMTAVPGEIYSVIGGNGAGKTTLLSAIVGDDNRQRGKILINGKDKKDSDIKIAVLAQNPQTLFVKKTVEDDLSDMLVFSDLSKGDKCREVEKVIEICELSNIRKRHPYDLSGGEQQKAALAKILLMKPQILLLDEPTKGIDEPFKMRFANILKNLKNSGVCVIIVSHDIEFCARYSDRCGFMFDGAILSEGTPDKIFSDNSFYTTAASRMSRGIIPNAVLSEDIVYALQGEVPETEVQSFESIRKDELPQSEEKGIADEMMAKRKVDNRIWYKIAKSAVFGILLIITVLFFHNRFEDEKAYIVQTIEFVLLALAINPFLPKRLIGSVESCKEKTGKRTIIMLLITLILVPLTAFIGFYFLQDRKYYFISVLIIIETLIPFVFAFENRQPMARELVVISVLCAIAVAGRMVFYMLPQFKPMAAIVIIAGVAFGGEAGFLVGAVSGFVSNFFFGQGPWTPWQMVAFGIIGFLAGILFKKGFLPKTKVLLCVFGGLSVVLIYGGIMNPASVIMFQGAPDLKMILSSYAMGLQFDIIHGISTVFFLWVLSEPFIEKIDRIKTKYELMK